MIRRAFLKRMCFAALACGFFDRLPLPDGGGLTGLAASTRSGAYDGLRGSTYDTVTQRQIAWLAHKKLREMQDWLAETGVTDA